MKKLLFVLTLFGHNLFGQINIIPKPNSVSLGQGQFQINERTTIVVPLNDVEAENVANQFIIRLKVVKNLNLEVKSAANTNAIIFKINNALPKEAYNLIVKPGSILIEAAGGNGFMYGYQTLLQLLPVEIFSSTFQKDLNLEVPVCIIKDQPRFGYRGVMLDVGRHYFPIEFIKKLIDNLALHKINTLHWHLTEDQGWRIEIEKYPKLTEVGSIRKESMVGHYSDKKYDGKPYGGFYTQVQIKELVAYAQKRYVTIIPEIEMPGHALAALASYPELGCTGGPYQVGTTWGVEKNVFCPTEQTFSFLEDVLTEVMDLFPSQYIHIGGDECPKDTWKNSTFCQELMKKEGLKDEHELQSYFIKRIDKFVTSKGRRIIGWDEILEGGLSPNATVMSWRGVEGGIDAARQKHDVIMSPNSFMYLDYYQAEPSNEPLAIGGLLPLEKTYSFDPTVSELKPEEAKYILGVQANLWTEYIKTPEYAEYMLFPRAIAAAEIGWYSGKKDYPDFTKRLNVHLKRLDNLAVNYSKSSNNVKFTTDVDAKKRNIIKMVSGNPEAIIRYTLSGDEPNSKSLIYNEKKPVFVSGDRTFAAAAFDRNGQRVSGVTMQSFVIEKSTRKSYTLTHKPTKYTGNDPLALTNGIRGSENNLDNWVGFEGKDFEAILDMGNRTLINRISVGFLSNYDSWILFPQSLEVFGSNDNKKFDSIKKLELGNKVLKEKSVRQINVDVTPASSFRYLKIVAKNYGKLPSDHPGAGKPAWLMIDEITVK